MNDTMWRILGWIMGGGILLIAIFLTWVFIEAEIYARNLRKMKDATDKKRVGPLEAGYRERTKRAAFLTTK